MKVFIVVHKGEAHNEVFTSLSMACDSFDLNYSSASKGKRVFVNDKNEVTTITEAIVSKIKGREYNTGRKN
jgi:hypothetical protein